MTLEQRITLLSQKVGNHIRDNVTPRLLPTTGTVGQVATKTAGGTVAFVDPFLKNGGTINGDLTVTGTNGTFSTNSVQSNLYYLHLTRSSVALTTVGNAGFGLLNPLAPVHAFGGTAMTAGWSKTSILQAQYPVQVFNSNSTKWAGIGYDSGYAMRFWVNATSDDVPGTGVPALSILNNGNINLSGGISSYFFKLPSASSPTIVDVSNDNTYINARVIYNGSGTYPDGLYLGYANNNGSANRIYDGGGVNYLRVGSSMFSSVGITKWLFGDQSDNGIFAQFAGLIHAKSGLYVNGDFSYGSAGTRTETILDAGEMGGRSGFFETYDPVNFPEGASSWWHLISARHSNTGNNYAMQIAGSFFDQRIYFRKTSHNGAMPWREFVSADASGNVSITGVINSAKGINVTGNGGFFNGASKFGMDFYGGNTRFYSSGSDSVTKGGYEFHSISSDGSLDTIPLFISNAGYIGFGTTTPINPVHIRQDINGGAVIRLSNRATEPYSQSGLFLNNATETFAIQLFNSGIAGFVSAQPNTARITSSTANGMNIFAARGDLKFWTSPTNSNEVERLTLKTNGDILFNSNRVLFGTQSDDGTPYQFAEAVKMKSSLTVTGVLRLLENIGMNNDSWQYWKDGLGNDRRILGVATNDEMYIGDIDFSMASSLNYRSKFDHIWATTNGAVKMRLSQNGTLSIEGGFKSPIRTMTTGGVINATDHVVIMTASPTDFSIDAPSLSNEGRELVLVNKSAYGQNLNHHYINLSGLPTYEIPSGQSIKLKYNGSEIHQI